MRRHPELNLPHELFDGLMTVFSSDAEIRFLQRDLYIRHGLRYAGFDEATFWSELESLTADYVRIRYDSPSTGRDDICRARYEALEAARNAFGRERFDKMLYIVVAPLGSMSAGTNGADPAARLRREAEGCR